MPEDLSLLPLMGNQCPRDSFSEEEEIKKKPQSKNEHLQFHLWSMLYWCSSKVPVGHNWYILLLWSHLHPNATSQGCHVLGEVTLNISYFISLLRFLRGSWKQLSSVEVLQCCQEVFVLLLSKGQMRESLWNVVIFRWPRAWMTVGQVHPGKLRQLQESQIRQFIPGTQSPCEDERNPWRILSLCPDDWECPDLSLEIDIYILDNERKTKSQVKWITPPQCATLQR